MPLGGGAVSADDSLDVLQRRFEPVRQELAKGDPPLAGDAMSAAARAIHKYANRPWQLSMKEEGSAFRLSTAQNILIVNQALFAKIMSSAISHITKSRDRFLEEL